MKLNFSRKCFLSTSVFFLAVLFGTTNASNAQSENFKRHYTTRAEVSSSVLGDISSPSNAADGDPESYASINSVLLGSPTLFLDFGTSSSTGTIDGNRPITVKLTLPGDVLSAVGGVRVQAIKNLKNSSLGWSATNVGSPVTKNNILGLLSGNGSFYITIQPGSDYDGVAISMSGVNALTSLKVYDAFIVDTLTNTVNCNESIDVLSGVQAPASVATITSNISNPWNAIDGDTLTFSSLTTGVQLLSQVYHTTVFSQPSTSGDSLKIVLKRPGGLLNISALNGFKIQPYLEDSALTIIDHTSSLLNIRLLHPGSDKQVLTVPINESFNRVKISLGGVANALDQLDIYTIDMIIPLPEITSSGNLFYCYLGGSVSLPTTSMNGSSLLWYSDSLSGTALTSNVISTSHFQGDTTLHFYAETTRPGCTEVSKRAASRVFVVDFNNNLPDTLGFQSSNYNDSVTVSVLPPLNLPAAPLLIYTIDSGTLPPGIILDSLSGQLNGIPNTVGTYLFKVKVFDAANNLEVGIFKYKITIVVDQLPIKLDYFRASLQTNQTALLEWATSSEQNSFGFAVEHSIDGKKWTQKAFIKSKAVEGNSNIDLNYDYVDKTPIKGITNYYRLKQMDFDHRFNYSKVKMVQLANETVIQAYPNPTNKLTTIDGLENAVALTVYDANGRRVLTKSIKPSDSNLLLSLENFKRGVYTLSIRLKDGQYEALKLLVK